VLGTALVVALAFLLRRRAERAHEVEVKNV
jgi:hypothetical protein